MTTSGTFVGIDVSKATLDVFILGERTSFAVTNDDEGIQALVERLKAHPVTLVAFESTGRYHEAVHAALLVARIPAHLANAARVKSFATAKGIGAKTDAQDARLLCSFAAFVEVPAAVPVDADVADLAALMQRRRQLKKTLVAEGLRRDRASALVNDSIDAVTKCLKEQVASIDAGVRAEMKKHSSRKLELLVSIPGVGETTAAAMMCWLPELGHLDSKKLVSLVGLAPFAQDSGQRFGKRTIRGGRERVRTALYMSAMVATRFNPTLKIFYQRLVASGKAKRAAILAVARKMIGIMNAMIKQDKEWSALAGISA